MALVVEDGTGKPDAESFASVAEAIAYHGARGNAAAWAAVADPEAALRLASDYMEQAYRTRWRSHRVTSTQRLSWPRAYVPMDDAPYGYGSLSAYYPHDQVPAEVKNACMELALIAGSQDLNPTLTRAARQETVGPITVVYDDSSPQYARYRKVDMMLSHLLSSGPSTMRLART